MITSGKDLVECYKEIAKRNAIRESVAQKSYNEQVSQAEKARKDFYKIQVANDRKNRKYTKMMESARNDALSTALKAIYITALEANSLTDEGIVLAETMVDRWIQENGGAYNILSKKKNNTYFLSRLTQIVEDAAKDEVEKTKETENDTGESDGKEAQRAKEEEKKQKEADSDPLNDTGFQDDEEDEAPAKTDDEEKEDDSDSKEAEIKKDSEEGQEDDSDEESSNKDPLGTSGDEDEVDSSSDDSGVEDMDNDGDTDDTDVAQDIVDDLEDVPDEDITVDGDTENKGKIFDDLEKEQDVKKAIEVIRNRVADAEETFIKRNAEDKKKIDELIDRISNNVKTVKDMDDQAETQDDTEQELNKSEQDAENATAQESVRVARRRVNQSIENRPYNLLEHMTKNLAKQITKDRVIREQYTGDDGRMDMQRIFEAGKVMYGFLETLNTLQLEKVDKDYITKLIHEI